MALDVLMLNPQHDLDSALEKVGKEAVGHAVSALHFAGAAVELNSKIARTIARRHADAGALSLCEAKILLAALGRGKLVQS